MPKCLECGTEFEKTYVQQKTCSEECRSIRALKRKRIYDHKHPAARRQTGDKKSGAHKGRTPYHRDDTFGLTPEERIEMGLRPLDPGPRPCACCGKEFQSWDRSRKVLCPSCTIDAEEHEIADVTNQGYSWNYHKTPR